MTERTGGGTDPLYIYLSAFDIAQPIGPAVNEYEFLLSVAQADTDVRPVIPEPSREMEGLDRVPASMFRLCSQGIPGMLLVNQMGLLIRAWPILRRATRERETAVVCRLPFAPWSIAILMLAFPRLPFFFKSVGVVDRLPEYKGLRHLFSRLVLPFHNSLTGFVLRHAAGVDTPTDKLAAHLAKRFRLDRQKVQVIPNGTNVDRFVRNVGPEASRNRITIGYIGGSPRLRGGRQVIEACARLREEFPQIGAVIVGGDEVELKALARERGVSDICEIPGRIPYSEVPSWFRQVDVLIATDDSARSAEFGNSNQKIRQALAMNVPVITNPSCEAVLLETGVVRGVDTNDIERVVAEVRALLAMALGERAALSERCRQVAVEHFSTAATLQQRLAFWRDRIAASKARR